MKSVAIVGFAPATRLKVRESNADEIWTLNWGYNYDFIPRIDRLFEMHPIWLYASSTKTAHLKAYRHWVWLRKPRPYPVYMLKYLPEVPNCIPYPIQEVTDYLFGGLLRKGGDPVSFYTSSVDYMMALAIYEKFDRIELYGVEMASDTEYRYQREGIKFIVGQALARGIEVYVPSNSTLFHERLYGYEGGQMIFRQDLERLRGQAIKRRTEMTARLQYLEGMINAAKQTNQNADELTAEAASVRDEVFLASAFEQVMNYLIKFVDLEEPELTFENPLRRIPLKEKK